MESTTLAEAWHVVVPLVPWLVPLLVLVAVATWPMPGRGPRSSRRDEYRSFKFENRRIVMARANGRCEAATFFIWARCRDKATEVDHIYPWSKGGPTIPSNGQALCHSHNRAKSNTTPAWWYVLGLERRRRTYVEDPSLVRVSASYWSG